MYGTLSYGIVSYGGLNYSHTIKTFGAPVISFRNDSSPYALLSPISYIQSAPDSGTLPVLSGEKSNPNTFRVYNNFELNRHIADALNVQITTYDGLGSSSKTAIKSVVNQKWLKLYQLGYGQSANSPAPPTNWYADELAVGGDMDSRFGKELVRLSTLLDERLPKKQ